MTGKKTTIGIIIIGLAVALVYGFFINPDGGGSDKLAFATYVNAKGQEWKIPKGDYEFTVSSGGDYPKFVTGFINPLDVKPGDVQHMRIVLNSDAELEKVWAEVEHDNGFDEVELELVSTTTVVAGLSDAPYVPNEAGVLVKNEAKSGKVAGLWEASAQNGEERTVTQYTYEGDWEVHDTHRRTYRTKFLVEDVFGRTDDLTLAWSDPLCYFNGTSLGSNCNVGLREIDGFPSGDWSTGGYDITVLGTGAILMFRSGNSLTIDPGSEISISQGGAIREGYMYYPDNDEDGFADNDTKSFHTQSSYLGETRADNYRAPGGVTAYYSPGSAGSAQIVLAPEKDRFVFINKALAVGPCPGDPNCPPDLQDYWVNPGNALTQDGGESYVSDPSNSSQYLQLSNFGFSLPTGGVTTSTLVRGVEIVVRARVNTGSAKLIAFAGSWPTFEPSVGGVVVSNTTSTDYSFGGFDYWNNVFSAGGVNNSNFSVWVQAYDAINRASVYVDSVKVRVYYETGPRFDCDENFNSTLLGGCGLVNGVHTSNDCVSAGGVRVNNMCKFGSTIPSGWTQYSYWSTTSGNFCSDFPCEAGGCSTGSHAWDNTMRETCVYQVYSGGKCVYKGTCLADYVERGAY